jgi:hypothetical protein
MTIIHVRLIGDEALLPHRELERLLTFARQNENIEIEIRHDVITTIDLMRLAESSGAFDFWKEAGEDIYTDQDGESI